MVAFILPLPDGFRCAVMLPLFPCLALGVVRGWQDCTCVPGWHPACFNLEPLRLSQSVCLARTQPDLHDGQTLFTRLLVATRAADVLASNSLITL